MPIKYLKSHCSNPNTNTEITVDWRLNSEFIEFEFQVTTNIGPRTSTEFTNNYQDNWGLWEYDVVEVFIKKEGNTYLELQVSRFEQPFALIIEKPREVFYKPKELKTEFSSTNIGNTWKSLIKIPFSEIPGTGNILYGNCFSCLGHGNRSFYGLNINTDSSPDFHRPELFINLSENKA